ncbi:hypothetical protein [uncultured Draconibacterium sp.]|uniref:hypothetical protein n=1 Tax=uncultured Draconibacterium sp. TaxID=1573823 RepID=UPI0025D0F231|nr:hypothetical protein [uncultured Draconibacterium sp.]
MIDIDFSKHLTRTLPYHKRQVNRLKLFYWPFIALQELFDSFIEWRRDVYYRANITGQVLSLQSLLNSKVADADNSILVKSYNDQGIWVQLSNEAGEGDAYKVSVSLIVEDNSYAAAVALEGEVVENTNIDFYVYIPQQVNIYEVEMWVNSYKIAGKRYQILQTA